jgi:multimeric flavodoxin WrbA
LIHLYDLDFSPCISCFYCKRKDKVHGTCAVNDDLSPVLESLKDVDGIIFGSPIYLMNLSAGMNAFLERFVFSNMIYSAEIPTVFPKTIPSAFIYTMNVTEEIANDIGLLSTLKFHQEFLENILSEKIKSFYVYNTYQFNDYDLYEHSIFSKENKLKSKLEQFPIDCKNAFNLGVELVEYLREYLK